MTPAESGNSYTYTMGRVPVNPERKFWVGLVRVILITFLGAFLPALLVVDWSSWAAVKAAAIAGAAAGVAAVVKVVLDLITRGQYPAPDKGVLPSRVAA
jgi:hypothetical protein